jgi:hypothetical protein
LKITALNDLGDLGPVEGTPVIYHVSVAAKTLAFGPWVCLLVLLLLPANRNLRAWAVLVPFSVLWLALSLMTKIPMSGNNAIAIDQYVFALQSLAFGLSALWLFSHHFGGRNRVVVLAIAAAFLALVAVMGSFLPGNPLLDKVYVTLFVLFAAQGIGLTIALAVGGFLCWKRYGPWRFALSVALGLLLLNGLYGIILMGLAILLSDMGGQSAGYWVFGLGMFVAMNTLASLIILLPFLILTFTNRLYRERFYAIFRLPGMVKATETETATAEPAAQ